MVTTPPSVPPLAGDGSQLGVSHVDAAKALASLMQMITNSSPAGSVASSSNATNTAAMNQMNPYDFLQAMTKFSPAPFQAPAIPGQSLQVQPTEKEKKDARPSSEAYHPQVTRSGRLPVVPPSDEINMETFIDFPSESESDDPDFRPPRLAALKAAASVIGGSNGKGKGKALVQGTEDEDEEYIAETDTASGDEEVLTAYGLAPSLSNFPSPVASIPNAPMPDFNLAFNPDLRLSNDFWTNQFDNHPSPLTPLNDQPSPIPTTLAPRRPTIAEAFAKPPSIAEAFNFSQLPPPPPSFAIDPIISNPPQTQTEEPKRKRGRPKSVRADEEPPKKHKLIEKPTYELKSTVGLPPAEKKEIIAERNRRTARTAQEKKKQELIDLKAKVERLEDENERLRAMNETLMKDRLLSLGVDLTGRPVQRMHPQMQGNGGMEMWMPPM